MATENDPLLDKEELDPLDPKAKPVEEIKEEEIPSEESSEDDDPTKLHFNYEGKKIPKNIYHYILDLFRVKDQIHIKESIEDIHDNVTFNGINVWVLICSIIVASIGLLSNSIPVVIGAMLISPLMGPIRGIGLGIGNYDFKLILKSLQNFGVMIVVSLISSYVFFLITPIDEVTPELLARTRPDFRDVLIAFFGGLAGIIAASKGKLESVVSGVAIATALMPPLCTAGFALSIGEMNFFLGAMYLFTINAIFICLSTLLFVRILKFPHVSYVNKKIERKVKLYTSLVVGILIIPAVITFYDVSLESIFKRNAKNYIDGVIRQSSYPVDATYHYHKSSFSVIEIAPKPGRVVNIPNSMILHWENQLLSYQMDTSKVHLIVYNDYNKKISEANKDPLSNYSKNSLDMIRARDEQLNKLYDYIKELEIELELKKKKEINIEYLHKALKIDYPQLQSFVFSKGFGGGHNSIDSLYTFVIHWDKKMKKHERKEQTKRLEKRIKYEIKNRWHSEIDSVLIIER